MERKSPNPIAAHVAAYIAHRILNGAIKFTITSVVRPRLVPGGRGPTVPKRMLRGKWAFANR